jgi:hypothetical protein
MQNLTPLKAEGQEGLERVLQEIWTEQPRSTNRDILFIIGQQTSLLKVDMSKQQVVIWHADFMNGRAANLTIKNAVINFIKANLKPDPKVTDDEILAIHFADHSRKKNDERQTAAGFFMPNGRMNIDVITTNRVELDTETQKFITELSAIFPVLKTPHMAASFVQAKRELDALTTATYATEYAKGGKHRATLFGDTEKGVTGTPTPESIVTKPRLTK